MSELSITRALVELKTLESRINKTTSTVQWIATKTKNKNSNLTEDEFKKTTISEYQSLNDLIKRRNQIKNAIVLSNSVTQVEIAGTRMTVSEAIHYKDIIQYKKNLLDILKKQKQQCVIEYESHKQKVQTKIDENIKIICGSNTKPEASVMQTVSDGIAKGDPIEMFDPLKLEQEIKDLETGIENFTANVDYVLSESNALTKIVV
jgi:hypothetical protein